MSIGNEHNFSQRYDSSVFVPDYTYSTLSYPLNYATEAR